MCGVGCAVFCSVESAARAPRIVSCRAGENAVTRAGGRTRTSLRGGIFITSSQFSLFKYGGIFRATQMENGAPSFPLSGHPSRASDPNPIQTVTQCKSMTTTKKKKKKKKKKVHRTEMTDRMRSAKLKWAPVPTAADADTPQPLGRHKQISKQIPGLKPHYCCLKRFSIVHLHYNMSHYVLMKLLKG